MGGKGYGGVGTGRVYTYRYTVTTRMTCIKISSDESHFNVSLIVRDKVTRPCPQTTFLKRKESRSGIEPRSFRLPAYRLTTRPHRLCYQDHATPFLIPVTCTVVSSFEEVEFQSRCCPTDCEKSRLRRYELRSLSLSFVFFLKIVPRAIIEAVLLAAIILCCSN